MDDFDRQVSESQRQAEDALRHREANVEYFGEEYTATEPYHDDAEPGEEYDWDGPEDGGR
jgi:hypothetical protein